MESEIHRPEEPDVLMAQGQTTVSVTLRADTLENLLAAIKATVRQHYQHTAAQTVIVRLLRRDRGGQNGEEIVH